MNKEKAQIIEDEMNYLLDVEEAIEEKLGKTNKRIRLVEEFIRNGGDKQTFLDWLDSEGKDYKDLIRGIGYYYNDVREVVDQGKNIEIAVSNDGYNVAVDIPMNYSKQLGYHSPSQKIVPRAVQSTLVRDGWGYAPKTDVFYPKSNEAYQLHDDIIGGWRAEDILAMDNVDIVDYLDALEIEHTWFDERLTEVDKVILKLAERMADDEEYANALGDRWREWQRKRGEKMKMRDERKVEKKLETKARIQARIEKRVSKSDCKEAYKSGEMDKTEYDMCKRAANAEKRRKLIEDGGGLFFQRVGHALNSGNPFTAASRGGFLLVLKMNIFGMATRLAPVFLDDPRFNAQYVHSARQRRGQIEGFWKRIGGNPKKLIWAINEGYNKKPKMTTQKARTIIQMSMEDRFSNYVGAGAAAAAATTATAVAAATPVVSTVTAILGAIPAVVGAGVGLVNVFKKGQEPTQLQGVEVPTQGEIDSMLPPELRGMRVSQDGTVFDASGREIKSNRILGMPKMVFYVGVSVIGLLLLILLLIPSKKSDNK